MADASGSAGAAAAQPPRSAGDGAHTHAWPQLRVCEADAGGASAPEQLPPAEPESLLGRRVGRDFQAGFFVGVITGVRTLPRTGTLLWFVRYEDGDREELTWPVLRSCLLDAGAGGSGAQPALLPTPAAQPQHGAQGDASAAATPRSGSAAAFKGVSACGSGFYAQCCPPAGSTKRPALGTFPTAVAAARAYDGAARRYGRRVVNFPKPGSGEVQAVPGETDKQTLQRCLPGGSAAALRPRKGARRPTSADVARSLVGRRVRMPFRKRKSGTTTHFMGTVTSRRAANNWFYVRFDDGDERACSAQEVRRCTVAGGGTQERAARAARRPARRDAPAAGAATPPPRKRQRLAAQAAPPAASASGSSADVADFLRGITPPLQHLAAVLAAVPRSGLTQEHLACLARTDAASPQFALLRQDILSGLGIETAADKFSFTRALLRTWQA